MTCSTVRPSFSQQVARSIETFPKVFDKVLVYRFIQHGEVVCPFLKVNDPGETARNLTVTDVRELDLFFSYDFKKNFNSKESN